MSKLKHKYFMYVTNQERREEKLEHIRNIVFN